MTDATPRVFVVVAAWNEATAIRPVIAGLRAVYPDVVVVDDGSTDATSEVLGDSGCYLLRHVINRGQGAALQTGIRFALRQGADVIVTFDADGQHDPADIPALVEPIARGECDVTLGSRFLGRVTNMPLGRRLVIKGAILFTLLVSRIRVSDAHNGLRGFSRHAAEALHIRMDRMAHASEILDQIVALGLRYKEVPVTVDYTRYSLEKGQSSGNALRIAAQVVLGKLLR